MPRYRTQGMPVPPKPPFEGPTPATMERGNRKSTAGTWLTKVRPVETPADLVPPSFDLSSLESPADIISSGVVPEVTPALLGVRAWVADWRLERTEEKIKEAARANDVRRFVGESLFKGALGENFLRTDQKHRPVTRKDRLVTNFLDRLTNARNKRSGHSYKAAHRYMFDLSAPKSGDEQRPFLGEPDFSRSGAPRSRPEKKHDAKTKRYYDKMNGQAARRDAVFEHVVHAPYRRAQKAAEKRRKLILKREAIRRAR